MGDVLEPSELDTMKPSIKREKYEKDCMINWLTDEVVTEILCRLPSCKSVTRCKSVSKHWAALVSQPMFISRFIATVANVNFTSETLVNPMNDETFSLVLRKEDPTETGIELTIHLKDPIANPRNVCSSYAPRPFEPTVRVVGACNDMLLYQRDCGCNKYEHYLYNVQTKQRLELPILHINIETLFFIVGFVCDSYYYQNCSNRSTTNLNTTYMTLNGAYRCCIVLIPYGIGMPTTHFTGYLLSTNTPGRWLEVTFMLPVLDSIVGSCHDMFGFAGRLHFQCIGGVIGFDPYHSVTNCVTETATTRVIQCRSFPKPVGLLRSTACTGVFDGCLRVCGFEEDNTFKVWLLRLQDYEAGEWSLLHSININDWILLNRRLAYVLRPGSYLGNMLSFHPYNPNLAYALSRKRIVLYDLSTKTLEIVSRTPRNSISSSIQISTALKIVLPIWPTPFPNLVNTDTELPTTSA